MSGLRVGGSVSFPGNEIANATKALWKLKLFTDVKIYKEKTVGNVIFLEIAVIERPTLSDYSLEGVKKVNDGDLKNIVDQYFQKGAIVTPSNRSNAIARIKKYYEEKGFLDAKVSIREIVEAKEANTVQLMVKVNRGQKVKIENIVFSGNQNISSKKLRKQMEATKIKKGLFSSSKYLNEGYQTDKKSLIQYYNTLGYRDATIMRDTVYQNSNGQLNIEVDINEGQKYYHRNITFKGNSIYSSEELAHLLDIKEGDVYNAILLDTRLHFSPDGRDVSTQYLDNGYLFFKVEANETAIVDNMVDLEFRIFEGPQATINKVIINGNDRTSEEVIRRELRTKPGQKFSRTDIVRSQRELINLGYFNPESVNISTPVDPENGTVDIVYELEEKSSDQVEVSGGFNPGTGVVGTVGLSFNNFSLRNFGDRSTWRPLPTGDGQRLSLRAQTDGSTFQTYNLSFTEPWLGGKKPNALSVGGSFTRLTSDDIPSNENFEKLSVANAFVGLGTRLQWPDDNFLSNTTLNYQRLNLSNWGQENFGLDDGTFLTDGLFHNISITQTFSRSTINHPFFPTSGTNFSLVMQFTPPYSLFQKEDPDPNQSPENRFKFLEYHKWRFNAEWYKIVTGKLTLKASAKIGLLGQYNSSTGLSPFERFVLGGDALSGQQGDLLGFDRIGLRGYDIDDFAVSANGGAAGFNKFTVELRYPIVLKQSASVYVHAFLEAGNAYSSIKDFNPFDLKRSAGFGFRAQVPFLGTIGVDYGLGFDKKNVAGSNIFNRYGQFSFTLGVELD